MAEEISKLPDMDGEDPQTRTVRTVAPETYSPHGKKKGLLVFLVSMLVLLAVIVAAGYIAFRHKNVSVGTTSATQSQSLRTGGVYVYFAPQTSGGNRTTQLVQVVSSKVGSTPVTTFADSLASANGIVVHKRAGHNQFMVNNNVFGAGGLQSGIAFQKDSASVKQLFLGTSTQNGDTFSREFDITSWPGAVNSTADAIDVIIVHDGSSSAANASKLVTLNADGSTVVHKSASKTSISDEFPVLSPVARSADGSKIYLQVLSCYFCDGPPLTKLIEFDIKTKQMVTLLSGLPNDGQGTAQSISDHELLIVSKHFDIGPVAPDEIAHGYIYDTTSKKLSEVFKTDKDGYDMSYIGMSKQKDRLYLAATQLKPDPKSPLDGALWPTVTRVVELKLSDHSIKEVKLPPSWDLNKVNFLNVDGTEAFVGYASADGTTGKLTGQVYALDLQKTDALPLELIKVGDTVGFGGFVE